MGQSRFASPIVMAVFIPYFLVSSLFAKTMPWRNSLLPQTAIGLPFRSGANAHSTLAKKLFRSECKITRGFSCRWIASLLAIFLLFSSCFSNFSIKLFGAKTALANIPPFDKFF